MDSPSSEQSEDENVLLEDTSDSEQCEEEISTEPDVVTAGSLSDLWQVVASISQTVQTMQESNTLLRRNTERILEYMGEYQVRRQGENKVGGKDFVPANKIFARFAGILLSR